MSYTYDEPVDGVFEDTVSNVRYLLGDKAPSTPFSLSDGEIQFELAQAVNVISVAAANAAFSMSIRYSAEAVTSKSVGNLSLSRDYAGMAGRFMALSRNLRSKANVGAVASGIFTGGTNIDPQFTTGQFDYK